ncbi:MAG: GNAT family N-acetyltransferase [Anaerovibrio sp.]|uniref:GNAT family N-acetyltransferase n=1 Tax=Anaerovibrio sp. TaxID=1872532 RepID=UPI0025B8903C|nr:GNAT family N-acetyltransferase [Anaerovibrio sp.]MBE6099349.1 GNAT family N-acetyltransferase [Anaerovibrio sp.]
MKYQMAAKELHNIEEWMAFQVKPSKVVVDSDAKEIAELLRNEGYFMVDRTIKAAISVKKDRDFSRLCRIPLERIDKLEKRIYEIAKQAFLPDSRFFDRTNTSDDEKRGSICAFVDEMKSVYICRFRGEIAGFLEVLPDVENQNQAFIRLAAVDEKYRVAGVAASLYAGAVEKCREQGIKKIWGRISSRNMSVMNLYASLGAVFSQPLDVYVRR